MSSRSEGVTRSRDTTSAARRGDSERGDFHVGRAAVKSGMQVTSMRPFSEKQPAAIWHVGTLEGGAKQWIAFVEAHQHVVQAAGGSAVQRRIQQIVEHPRRVLVDAGEDRVAAADPLPRLRAAGAS